MIDLLFCAALVFIGRQALHLPNINIFYPGTEDLIQIIGIFLIYGAGILMGKKNGN